MIRRRQRSEAFHLGPGLRYVAVDASLRKAPPSIVRSSAAAVSRRLAAGVDGSPLAVYAVDAGSLPAGRFAWCRLTLGADAPTAQGRWPDELAAALASDLTGGAVALGIEAPLWWPVPPRQGDLGKARRGEGDRPWSAGAGATITPTAVTQLAWILREVAKRCVLARPTFATERVVVDPRAGDLLLWEAFVSRRGERGDTARHSHDARAAAQEFVRRAHDLPAAGSFPSDVIAPDGDVLNLAAAAATLAGLDLPSGAMTATTTVVTAPP